MIHLSKKPIWFIPSLQERRVAVGWSPTRAALARVVTHSAVYAPFSDLVKWIRRGRDTEQWWHFVGGAAGGSV